MDSVPSWLVSWIEIRDIDGRNEERAGSGKLCHFITILSYSQNWHPINAKCENELKNGVMWKMEFEMGSVPVAANFDSMTEELFQIFRYQVNLIHQIFVSFDFNEWRHMHNYNYIWARPRQASKTCWHANCKLQKVYESPVCTYRILHHAQRRIDHTSEGWLIRKWHKLFHANTNSRANLHR